MKYKDLYKILHTNLDTSNLYLFGILELQNILYSILIATLCIFCSCNSLSISVCKC